MKKYIAPALQIVRVDITNALLTTSSVGVGGNFEGESGDVQKGGRGRAWRDYEGR